MPALMPRTSSRCAAPQPYVPPKEEVREQAELKRPEPLKQAQPSKRDDEYGDVLSPEDFDKPVIEDDDDDEGDDLGVSLSAMEAELKPKVLEIFDSIAKHLQVAAQAAGPGSRRVKTDAFTSQERRYKQAARRDHRRSEVTGAEQRPHRGAGRAAL